MELEDLKATWSEMNQQLEQQKKTTKSIIMKMTSEHSKSRLNTLVNFEIIGMVISTIMIVYIVGNFNQLDDWLSLVGGIGTSLILVSGLYMSFVFIKRARKIDIAEHPYSQTLMDVAHLRKSHYQVKRLSIGMAVLLPFLILPVLASIHFDKNLLNDLGEYRESLIPAIIIVPAILYLVNRLYTKKIDEVNKLIKDIEE